MCGLGFTVGCYLAVKERVSSVDRDSNNYKYRYNGMGCGDPTLHVDGQSVYQGT